MRHFKVIAVTVLFFITAGAFAWRHVKAEAEGMHARSSLEVVIDLSDKAIHVYIASDQFREAIDLAESIEAYYPLGTVLPKTHDFAAQYGGERKRCLNDIAAALRERTHKDCGIDWPAWRAALMIDDKK